MPTSDGAGEPVILTQAALGSAFDDFASDVYRRCMRVTGDVHEAEDLMSIVFLEAWRSRQRAVLVDGSLRPWLFGITANVVKSRHRSRRRHSAALAAFAAGDAAMPEPDCADAATSAADAPSERARIDAALAHLGQRDYDVARACLVDGLSPADAATRLELSEAAVKSRLSRARRHLKALLHPSESHPKATLGSTSGHETGKRRLGAPADALKSRRTG